MLRGSLWLLGGGGGREKREHRAQEAAAIIHVVGTGVACSKVDAKSCDMVRCRCGPCRNRICAGRDTADLTQ